MKLTALLVPILFIPAALWSAGEKNAEGTLRCRAIAVIKAPAETLYVKTGDRYVPLKITTDFIGKSFRTDAKEGLVFYRKLPDKEAKPANGKKAETYAPLASCKPDGTGRQLLFISPGQGDSWNMSARSDVDGNFPPGTRLVFNLSTFPVSFDFGGTRLLLNPRQSGLLKSPVKSEEGVAHINVARQGADGKWIQFMSSSWRCEATDRKITFVYPSGTYMVGLSSIQDTVEEMDSEEKKAGTLKK